MMTFATCGKVAIRNGELTALGELAFDNPPDRLGRYWDKLDRQLSAYARKRSPKPVKAIDNDSEVAVSDAGGERPPAGVSMYHASPDRLDRRADDRLDPARMTDEERAAVLDDVIQNDSAAVEQRMRRFHRTGWRIADVMDANYQPIIEQSWIAYSRLPVCGIADGWTMPEPILSPEYVACDTLADRWREEAGIQTNRQSAIDHIVRECAAMVDSLRHSLAQAIRIEC